MRDPARNAKPLARLLKTGDVYVIPDKPGLELLTGNAGGLVVMVDGEVAPPLEKTAWSDAASRSNPRRCARRPPGRACVGRRVVNPSGRSAVERHPFGSNWLTARRCLLQNRAYVRGEVHEVLPTGRRGSGWRGVRLREEARLHMGPAARRSIPVKIGPITVGGTAPIVVQSMTNTDTADIQATVEQVAALARAGSELVRITVDRDESARAVPHIRDALDARGLDVPLIGDFHYIGHKLLTENPACAEALAKYRINPGNVGFREKRDRQFSTMIDVALNYDRPVRIGVNWGSLDQELVVRMMDENARSPEPKTAARLRRRRWSCPPSRAPGGRKNSGSPPSASSSPVR